MQMLKPSVLDCGVLNYQKQRFVLDPTHLINEIVDNSVDEYLAGYANKIIVTLYKDNSISIEDNGRGIPIDIHSKTKKPAVETIFTVLHAGGKFGGENSGYKVTFTF